jgi:hypothetical protein
LAHVTDYSVLCPVIRLLLIKDIPGMPIYKTGAGCLLLSENQAITDFPGM